MKFPRIAGVDLAYAIALCFLMAFSFSVGLTDGTNSLSNIGYNPLVDTFIAMFFFLNGLTSTLMLTSKTTRTKKVHRYLIRKGTFFFIAGFIISFFWPVNFLMTLGLLFMASPLFLQLNGTILRFITIILVGVTMISFALTDMGSVSPALGMRGNHKIFHDLVNMLFVSGYDRFLPWAIFYLGGLGFGRLDFMSRKEKRRNNLFALVAVGIGIIIQVFGGIMFMEASTQSQRLIFPFLAHPQVNVFTFICGGLGFCVLFLNLCLNIMTKLKRKSWVNALQKVGSMKHTLYFAHLAAGIILISIFQKHGFRNLWALSGIIGSYLLGCFLFVMSWKRKFKNGPIEWLLHQIGGTNEQS